MPGSSAAAVRWSVVGRTFADLACAGMVATDEALDGLDVAHFARLLRGLTRPLVLLDELATAAQLATDGDVHAQRQLTELLAHVQQMIGGTTPPDLDDDGCCDPCVADRPAARRGTADLPDIALDGETSGDPDHAALDQTALTQLLIDTAQLSMAADSAPRSTHSRRWTPSSRSPPMRISSPRSSMPITPAVPRRHWACSSGPRRQAASSG